MYTNNMKDDQIVLFKGLQKQSVDCYSVLELTFLDSPVPEAWAAQTQFCPAQSFSAHQTTSTSLQVLVLSSPA